MTYDEGVAICAGEGARHAQPRTQQEYDDMLYFMGNTQSLFFIIYNKSMSKKIFSQTC